MGASEPIRIDGSFGEGGGAILRQALGLSVYTGDHVHIVNIRSGRRQPGLRPQHLAAVRVAAAISQANVEGVALGTQELLFRPATLVGGESRVDVGTAGSVTLLLQSVLLPILLSEEPFTLHLIGGTDVPFSPPVDYLGAVTLPSLAGIREARLGIQRRGYLPSGGGRVRISLSKPPTPRSIERLEPGAIWRVRGVSHAARALKTRSVAERQARAAEGGLQRLEVPVEIGVEYSDSPAVGSGITVWADTEEGPTFGGSALGRRGKPAERVGREAARVLLEELDRGGAVDRYLADQLVPFLGVVGGAIRTTEVTPHVRSNCYVVERILGVEVEVDEAAGLIRCTKPALSGA